MRTIRVDFRFQWTRLNDRNEIDDIRRFDVDRSAYVLKLDYLDDGDKRRKGRCSLVTAERGVVESWVKSIRDGSNIVSYSDVVNAQMMSYNDKIKWFQDTCVKLSEDWGKTYNKCKIISVRRDFLLQDSMVKVMSFSRRDMRTIWRIEYIGEEGLDAGGLAKEWFELVTNEVFNPDLGLWKMSEANQMSLEINPASGELIEFILLLVVFTRIINFFIADNRSRNPLCVQKPFCKKTEHSNPNAGIMQEGHLVFYRFLGRVMGKGLFDQRLIKGHMVKHLYKHILGWPVMFNDLKDIDEEYYNNLKKLPSMGADVDCLGSNFTQTEDIPALNMKEEKEMIPNGASIDVTEENLPEYMEACLNYRLLGRYKEQVNELLLGFYDVIPEPLLTIFDFQELELLMCGLPVIDMDDWMKNTEYLSNFFPGYGPNHDVCRWFWEVVSEFDQEMKARLLQFVTGTSGVPPGGFGTLQGMSTGGGTGVRKFQICGIPLSMSNYPKSQ
jgi:E3 ubiquitin-protein ligase NEDD4